MVNKKCIIKINNDNTFDVSRCVNFEMIPMKKISLSKCALGKGSYGCVIPGVIELDDKMIDVAIKVIIKKGHNRKNLLLLNKEVEYATKMGNADIGPKVYSSFYWFNKQKNKGYQFIIMEKMDTDVYNYLKTNSKYGKEAVSDILKIIYRQIYDYRLFCSDIKSSNFLISIKTNEQSIEEPRVRMIDFDYTFCNKKIPYNFFKSKIENINLFYALNLLMLAFSVSPRYNSPITDDVIFNKFFIKDRQKNKNLLLFIIQLGLFSYNLNKYIYHQIDNIIHYGQLKNLKVLEIYNFLFI